MAWLGWDAERAADCAGLELAGLPRPRAELVAAPRRYGFHATLKAPFRLAEAATSEGLDKAVEELAAEHAPFKFRVGLRAIDAFLALTPEDWSHTITHVLAVVLVAAGLTIGRARRGRGPISAVGVMRPRLRLAPAIAFGVVGLLDDWWMA